MRSERRSPSPSGKGEEEGQFGKVAASQNSRLEADCGTTIQTIDKTNFNEITVSKELVLKAIAQDLDNEIPSERRKLNTTMYGSDHEADITELDKLIMMYSKEFQAHDYLALTEEVLNLLASCRLNMKFYNHDDLRFKFIYQINTTLQKYMPCSLPEYQEMHERIWNNLYRSFSIFADLRFTRTSMQQSLQDFQKDLEREYVSYTNAQCTLLAEKAKKLLDNVEAEYEKDQEKLSNDYDELNNILEGFLKCGDFHKISLLHWEKLSCRLWRTVPPELRKRNLFDSRPSTFAY